MAELDSTLLDLSSLGGAKSPEPSALFIQTNKDKEFEHQMEENVYGDQPLFSDEIGSDPGSALKLTEKAKNRINIGADYISDQMNVRSANSLRPSDLDNSTNHETAMTRKQKATGLRRTATTKMVARTQMAVKVTDLNSMVQIRKRAPARTFKEKQMHKIEKERQMYQQKLEKQSAQPAAEAKILDGFLLLHSCKVKLPHEAENSKLSGQQISDVRQEDLAYFKNLTAIDLSDNKMKLEWLTNLEGLEEIDLQYNSLQTIDIYEPQFPKLKYLHLSFNRIPPAHIENLCHLPSLLILNLASNDLCTLPSDMSYLCCLEEFNLASNEFSSSQALLAPNIVFDALSTIPQLKKLNLSRNRLEAWHATKRFNQLVELYFAFNLVEEERMLFPAIAMNPNLTFLVITGNPFATLLQGPSTLDIFMAERASLGGEVLNESINPPDYLRGARPQVKEQLLTNMVNYGQSKNLVQVEEPNIYWGSDPFVVQKPLPIDHQPEQPEQQPEGFFITENEPPLLNEPPQIQKQKTDIFMNKAANLKNYGQIKMDFFKMNARQILAQGDSTTEYNNTQVTDVVTAYKSLKQLINKAQGGSKPLAQVAPNAGFLKNTIACQQHSKQRVDKDLLRFSLDMKQQTIKRAATGQGQRRTIRNGELKVVVENKNTGMLVLQGQDRAQTAGQVPIWRKTHQQKVDSKIEQLFESYKAADQKQMALDQSAKDRVTRYF